MTEDNADRITWAIFIVAMVMYFIVVTWLKIGI